MKKFYLFLSLIIFANSAFAQVWPNPLPTEPGNSLPGGDVTSIKTKNPPLGFYFDHNFLFEYSVPIISGGGTNTEFKASKNLLHQIKDIENISFGQHFRIHKYLGLEWSWTQTDLDNTNFQDAGPLAQKAGFRMDHYDFAATFFLPTDKDFFEVFAKIGVSDMKSKLRYVKSDGTFIQARDKETKGIYGIGLQFDVNKKDKLRVYFQKYAGKLALLDAHYSTLRVGYLKNF